MRVAFHILICAGIAASLFGTAFCTAELFAPEASVVTSLLIPGPGGESKAIDGFPHKIPGTDLQIQDITAYEGPYLEDGTYEEICDVAVLIVSNTSEHPLETVEISLFGLRRTLEFSGTWLPPGSRCVLLEKNRRLYREESYVGCSGNQSICKEENALENITLEEVGDDTLCLVNGGPERQPPVLLRYKTYMQEEDLYIGGVTNEVLFPSLAPGETYTLTPPRYVKGYGKIIFAQVDKYVDAIDID